MTAFTPATPHVLAAIEMTASALLFDMDGTLLNSDVPMIRAYTALARRYALDPTLVLETSRGRRVVDTINTLAPKHADVRADLAFVEQLELEDLSGVIAIPGASFLLHSLPSHTWAVVTSASRELACRRFMAAGLPLPNVMITAEDVTLGKPDPEGYLLAAQRLGVDVQRCIVFEDAVAGVAAARAAGAQVIAITTALAADQFGETLCIPDMHAVTLTATIQGDALGLVIHPISNANDRK